MKRIIFIDNSNIFAGAEYCLLNIISKLNKENYNCTLCCLFPQPHHQIYKNNGIKIVYRTKKNKWWMGSEYFRKTVRGTDLLKRIILSLLLIKIILKNKPNIIHFNLLRTNNYFDIVVSKFFKVKIVGHIRSLKSQCKIKNITIKKCDQIICTSEFVYKENFSITFLRNVHYIYDPIKSESYDTSSLDKDFIRKKYSIDKHSLVLVSVAILDQRKGHDTAIVVLSELVSKGIDAKLIIAGGSLNTGNKELLRLKSLALYYKVLDRIIFTGHVANIAEIYAVGNIILALSKDGEAFGRVPLEAASAKRIVISSNLGAAPEIVIDGITGFLVKPTNILEICNKILFILDNGAIVTKMIEVAYMRVLNEFSVENHVKSLIQSYNQLILKH